MTYNQDVGRFTRPLLQRQAGEGGRRPFLVLRRRGSGTPPTRPKGRCTVHLGRYSRLWHVLVSVLSPRSGGPRFSGLGPGLGAMSDTPAPAARGDRNDFDAANARVADASRAGSSSDTAGLAASICEYGDQ